MSTPRQQRVTELLTALFDYDEKNLSSFSNSVQRANELEYPIPGERGMQLENMRFILSNRDSLLESVPQASEQMLTYMEKDLLSTLQYVGYTTANPYMIENLRSMTASDEQTTYLYFNAMLKEEALRRLDENRAELETIRKSYCDELDAQRWARLRETRARYDSLEDKIIEIADDNTKLEPIDESTPERFAKTWAAHKDGIARLDAVKQERSNIVRSMPEITYLPRNYQRKENEQLTSKLSKGFEWVSVAQEQVRQSILDDTMNLWEITPVVVSVLERMQPTVEELAAIERKMESDKKKENRFKIGTVGLSAAATIACFFLSGGAATALQLAAKAGAVTVATAGGIVMGVDELANALETERMVYASMYGKEYGAFTDEDIVSAKNGTRATAFLFALDIFGAFEAIQAWKMLGRFNGLSSRTQDVLGSLKDGKKVLETLSPEQLSRLSQLPSNDPIYPLLDTMKNGRINGVSVDEYIAIRQRANQGVGNVDTTFTQSKQIIKPGTSEHKTLSWESYKDAGGEWDYERWSKTYENNMLRATKANEAVDQYHEAIKWGNREVTVDILLDNSSVTRRLDIADIDLQQGIEYKTGYTYAREDIVWEVTRDSELVRNGWDITWVIEGRISTPLENLLLKNHIKVIKR